MSHVAMSKYIFEPLILLLVVLLFGVAQCDPLCPSLCWCKSSRSGDNYGFVPQGQVSNVDAVEWIKLKCGGPQHPITEIKEIDLTKIVNLVLNLNLSGNGISTLSRDLNLPQLQKLDISNNIISLIESDAFYNLSGLQRLDLSGNLIKIISKEIFKGLHSLEKLILSQNKIATLANDTFDYLLGLKQLDISSNPLKCDCDLVWVPEWSRSANIKLMGNPKCEQPSELNGQSIKKLRSLLDPFKCGLVPVTLQNKLVLKPGSAQIVFEGDSLSLSCKAPFSTVKTIYNLTWSLPNNTVDLETFRITNKDVLEEGLPETILKILRISSNHTGTYRCSYSNINATLMEDINITVISNLTTYCPITVTSNNKGVYTWPGSLTGNVVSQTCHNRDGAQALYYCSDEGNWIDLNTTSCPYTSETTKMLEQFALVNLSVYKGSTLSACKRLHSLLLQHLPSSSSQAILSDPDDVNFITKAIINYLSYVTTEPDVGSVLLDIVNTVMLLPSVVLKAAENLYSSCSAIVAAVENISHYTVNVQGQKNNLVVEHFSIKRESFGGMTCLWYSVPTYSVESEKNGNKLSRMLHCSTTNRTITPLLNARDKIVEASVQIPGTLLYRMDHQSLLSSGPGNLHRSYSLVVSMYDNAALFPLMPEVNNTLLEQQHKTREWDFYGSRVPNTGGLAITTPVVGVKLLNVTLTGPLASPMYIIVRDSDINTGVSGRAVLWDEETRTWSDTPDGCSVLRIVSNMVVIQCYKLGYVGLMQNVETGIYGARSGGARFRFSHPAIYVGSIILLICLLVSILTYAICYPFIHMAPRAKHSLLNTWLSLALLCFMYTLGIYQTEDIQLCQAIGVLLHYLTLSSFLWMTVAVSQLYKFLTKNQNPTLQSPDDELPSEVPVQKPILGIYLVGWGIALIVCGISGAVNMREYASYSHCFLNNAPALSAVFVPASIVIIFISILFLLIRCTIRNVSGQLSEGTQATENVDLETWEPSLLVNNTTDRQSEQSSPETEIEDTEHTPVVQLRAHVIVLGVYLAVWMFGSIVVYQPFPVTLPYEEDIFSILYALFATVLGTFILFFYGIARSDVRAQWALMHCYFKKSKQCCRERSVFDTNAQNVPSNAPPNPHNLAPISNIAAAQARSRSNSQNSSRTNSKSNNSNILKAAAAELNGQTLHDSLTPHGKKITNMNLVVLHRQQYRSNNSVTTFPDSTAGAEMFYNPNQSNVARKFFKKQRKHMKKNYLDIPKRRNYDSDSQVSSHRPCQLRDGMSSMLTSSSKVSNMNIHVERDRLSDTGIKEAMRNRTNPNILDNDEGNGKIPLKRFTLEKENQDHVRQKSNDPKPGNQNVVMNIYTNVPETTVPQHQVVATDDVKTDNGLGHSSSMSAECLNMPTMRTVSQQCSLEYSSTSEVVTPHQLGSDKTLNTHSELNSLQEAHSNLCSMHEITSDTEEAHSFEKYTDFTKTKKGVESSKQHMSCSKLQNELKRQSGETIPPRSLNRSLQDIQQKTNSKGEDSFDDTLPTPCSDHYLVNENLEASELDKLMLGEQNDTIGRSGNYYRPNDEINGDFNETNSIIEGEQRYDNESDIYFPNYQMSEVSIRSHGLYAPPPASIICANDEDIHFSNSEISRVQNDDDCCENQYVNYNPAWRKTKDGRHSNSSRYYHSPAVSCPDVNRLDNDSPVSFISEIDELYKQITSRDRLAARRMQNARGHLDTLRHCESDSCISESHSDILDAEQQRGETRV